MAYHALFETGSYPRGCYTNLLDGAPVLADGLQHVSPDIQKIVLPVVAEMVAKRQAAAWPASLPPLVPLLEHLATRSADLAIRFEADGILRALDPARPATASASKQGPAGPGTTANSLLQYPFASQPADLQPASSLRSATLSSEDLRY